MPNRLRLSFMLSSYKLTQNWEELNVKIGFNGRPTAVPRGRCYIQNQAARYRSFLIKFQWMLALERQCIRRWIVEVCGR